MLVQTAYIYRVGHHLNRISADTSFEIGSPSCSLGCTHGIYREVRRGCAYCWHPRICAGPLSQTGTARGCGEGTICSHARIRSAPSGQNAACCDHIQHKALYQQEGDHLYSGENCRRKGEIAGSDGLDNPKPYSREASLSVWLGVRAGGAARRSERDDDLCWCRPTTEYAGRSERTGGLAVRWRDRDSTGFQPGVYRCLYDNPARRFLSRFCDSDACDGHHIDCGSTRGFTG